jgi:hypothetical protein
MTTQERAARIAELNSQREQAQQTLAETEGELYNLRSGLTNAYLALARTKITQGLPRQHAFDVALAQQAEDGITRLEPNWGEAKAPGYLS